MLEFLERLMDASLTAYGHGARNRYELAVHDETAHHLVGSPAYVYAARRKICACRLLIAGELFGRAHRLLGRPRLLRESEQAAGA
jgi:hypothetical protein